MLLDENGNPIEMPETPAEVTGPADPQAPTPATDPVDPLDPILKPMGRLQALLESPDTDAPDKAKLCLQEALDAFSTIYGHQKVRRGVDYEVYIRKGGRDGAVVLGISHNTTRGRDFSAAWDRFMADMNASAREAQSQAIIGLVIQRQEALERVVNQLLVKVAALETKGR